MRLNDFAQTAAEHLERHREILTTRDFERFHLQVPSITDAEGCTAFCGEVNTEAMAESVALDRAMGDATAWGMEGEEG